MSTILPITSAVTPYTATAAQPSLTADAGSTNGGQNVDAVSKDFEAVFLSQMMNAMFSGDDLTNFFGGGTAGDVYKGYMLNELGKSMAQAGGIGIADIVKKELLSLQEAA